MKACFFDLDGTLLDTLADIGAACNAVLAAHACPVHPVSAYRQMIGNGFPTLMHRALPPDMAASLPPARIDELTEEGRRYYAEHLSVHTAPYPGLPRALARLQDAGLQLAVLSNKPDDLTRALVPMHFPDIRFAAIRGGRKGAPLKPDPAVLLEMAARMGVTPRECLYVGDSDVDMMTARNAGMLAVGVAWGFRGAAEVEAAGAAVVAADAQELADIILNS